MALTLNETQQAVKQDYEQRKERTAALTNMTLQVTEGAIPTPTQEECDLLKLGLMHPDDIGAPEVPEPPPLHAQQAYLATGEGRMEPVQAATQAQRSVPRPPPAPPRQAEQRPSRSE